jgi:hypothetical protein
MSHATILAKPAAAGNPVIDAPIADFAGNRIRVALNFRDYTCGMRRARPAWPEQVA